MDGSGNNRLLQVQHRSRTHTKTCRWRYQSMTRMVERLLGWCMEVVAPSGAGVEALAQAVVQVVAFSVAPVQQPCS